MRRLLMASLILLLSSFTDISSNDSQIKLQNQITKTVIKEAPISLGKKYLKDKYKVICENIPDCLPFDTTANIRVTDVFRYRGKHPVTKTAKMHYGIDFAGKRGTLIYPAAKGVVSKVSYSFSYGNYIIIDHGNNVTSLYAHLKSVDVQENCEVNIDTPIAKLGSTGLSTGPHLHFEVRIFDTPINPAKLVFKNTIKVNYKKLEQSYAENRTNSIKPTTWVFSGNSGFKTYSPNGKTHSSTRTSANERNVARENS